MISLTPPLPSPHLGPSALLGALQLDPPSHLQHPAHPLIARCFALIPYHALLGALHQCPLPLSQPRLWGLRRATVKIGKSGGGGMDQNLEKVGKIRKERGKLGRFFSPCPYWQVGLAMLLTFSISSETCKYVLAYRYNYFPTFSTS